MEILQARMVEWIGIPFSKSEYRRTMNEKAVHTSIPPRATSIFLFRTHLINCQKGTEGARTICLTWLLILEQKKGPKTASEAQCISKQGLPLRHAVK